MSPTWVIDGSTGFEQLRIGEDRSAVRARFGHFQVFRRAGKDPETDYFVASGIQVTYDDEGHVEFIEIMAPADPLLRGARLLARATEDVIADLRVRGVECVEDRAGAYLPGWRVGLFAIGGIVEGVSINDSAWLASRPVRDRRDCRRGLDQRLEGRQLAREAGRRRARAC